MKFLAIVCLATFAAATMAAPRASKMEEVAQDFKDIWNELPTPDIIRIIMEHSMTDSDVQAMVEYALSNKKYELLQRVIATPESKALDQYFGGAGYSVSDLLPEITPMKPSLRKDALAQSTGGVKALLDDIFAILPVEALQKKAAEKMEKENFSGFIALFKTDEFKTLVRAAAQSSVIRAAYQELLENHIDLQDLVKRVDAIFPGVYETLVGAVSP